MLLFFLILVEDEAPFFPLLCVEALKEFMEALEFKTALHTTRCLCTVPGAQPLTIRNEFFTSTWQLILGISSKSHITLSFVSLAC